MDNSLLYLKKEYDKLLRKKRIGVVLSAIMGASLVTALFAALMVVNSLQEKELLPDLWWKIPLFFGAVIPIIVLFPQQKRFLLENRQLIFLNFYNSYQKLEKVKENYDKNKNKAIRNIRSLSYFIESWTLSNAPESIKKVPTSIGKNLREKIITIIENNDKMKIEIYSKSLLDDCILLYNREPTFEEWVNVSNRLELLKVERKKPSKKPRQIPIDFFVRPYVSAPIIWASLFTIMLYSNNNLGLSVVMSAVAAFAGSRYFSGLRRNKPTLKEQN